MNYWKFLYKVFGGKYTEIIDSKFYCPSCFTDKHMDNTYYFIFCKKCKRTWVLDDSKEAVKKWRN